MAKVSKVVLFAVVTADGPKLVRKITPKQALTVDNAVKHELGDKVHFFVPTTLTAELETQLAGDAEPEAAKLDGHNA